MSIDSLRAPRLLRKARNKTIRFSTANRAPGKVFEKRHRGGFETGTRPTSVCWTQVLERWMLVSHSTGEDARPKLAMECIECCAPASPPGAFFFHASANSYRHSSSWLMGWRLDLWNAIGAPAPGRVAPLHIQDSRGIPSLVWRLLSLPGVRKAYTTIAGTQSIISGGVDQRRSRDLRSQRLTDFQAPRTHSAR